MSTTHDVALHDETNLGPEVPSGTVRADLTTHAWHWSDEIYALYGLEPGQIVPTTGAFLAHVHPDDRDGVGAALRSLDRGGIVSTLHRVVAAGGRQHVVCLMGQAFAAGPEGAIQFVGHVADLSQAVKRSAALLADASIEAAARSRSDIEQAKAILGLVLDVDDEAAFGLLRRRSNQTNVPVRLVARSLVAQARATPPDQRLSPPWTADFLAPSERDHASSF